MRLLAAGREGKVMRLNRWILKQIPDIRKEIQDLQRAAGQADRGIRNLQKKKALMEKKRTELLQLENEAEEYIQSIDDSGLRRIIRLRYMDDLSWQQVAAQMGDRYSAESCRKKAERFMSDRATGQ